LDETGFERVSDPEARVAVGLELDANLSPLRPGIAIGAAEHTRQVLDVMSVLVGQDVRLGERPAAGSVLRLELVEEAQVDVYVRVVRAVERAGRRGRRAAAGLDASVEEPRLRRLVAAERAAPVRLDAVDHREDTTVLALVRVGSRAALL